MIKDLLWACVVCGAVESIRPDEKQERCSRCGTRYWRGRGSNIVVEEQGRSPIERTPQEWLRQLPAMPLEGSADCTIRMSDADKPIRAYGTYMGRYEHFGPSVTGRLTLRAGRIVFQPAAAGDISFDWSVLDLTAIQLSSSTLQLKAKQQPVVTVRFATSSSKLWEERLQQAVRVEYRAAGKGDVVEFQPRIVTR